MLSVALVDPQIPQNAGNIARLCSCTGTKLYFIGNLGFFLSDKHLKRAGLDYWDELEYKYIDNLEEFISKIEIPNYYFLSTKAKKLYTEVNYTSDDVLIFGSETKGLPENYIFDNPDRAIRIPMINNKRSLNLANSVSIVLYEAIRQARVFEDKANL